MYCTIGVEADREIRSRRGMNPSRAVLDSNPLRAKGERQWRAPGDFGV